ncbi:MAG: SirB1 family protein [Leptothrix sp. (in: b-proteobacteria)]
MNWTSLTPLEYFASLVADDRSFPLTEAVVALAQDEDARHDLQTVLADIDALAARLKVRLPADASPLVRLRQLQRYFFQELGFAGHQEVRSAADNYLHEVLRTRRGSPLALAVIYLELAGQIGLHAEGVSFPGHFLIRLSLPLGDVVLDPLNGQSLSRETLIAWLEPHTRQANSVQELSLDAYLRPAAAREIVAHLLRQLEAVQRRTQDWTRLLAVQQRLVTLLPQEHDWRRERGLTLAQLGHAEEAIVDLADYLGHVGLGASDRAQVAAQLRALRATARARWY